MVSTVAIASGQVRPKRVPNMTTRAQPAMPTQVASPSTVLA